MKKKSGIEWMVKRTDYDNTVTISVRITRQEGKDQPTIGDLLDTTINYVIPRIRKGELRGNE